MTHVRVFFDPEGNTLTVWFGESQDEFTSEETGDEVILIKNRNGQVIGFEKLNFSVASTKQLRLTFETMTA